MSLPSAARVMRAGEHLAAFEIGRRDHEPFRKQCLHLGRRVRRLRECAAGENHTQKQSIRHEPCCAPIARTRFGAGHYHD